jgi:phospholipid/cholesterol/gamma-HCH transport system substrate-binding protein
MKGYSMRSAAMLGALALATAGLSGCGGGSGSETVVAKFVSAAPLVKGNQIKVDGIVVGTVEDLRVRNGLAEVTMELDPEAMPLHSDAKFIIRPATLLGERFVDLDRGTASAPLLDTSRVVPTSQTGQNVGLDDVLNTFDDPTGAGLAALFTTLGTGVRGNGKQVDETITTLAPSMQQIEGLAAVLKNHNELLGALVQDSEPILGALADNNGQSMDKLVGASDRLLAASAAKQAELDDVLKELPGTLESGSDALKQLSKTADDATPTLKELKPFTKNLDDFSDELRDFSEALDPALASSQQVLDRADQLLLQAQRPSDDLRVASPDLETAVEGTRKVVHGLSENRDTMFDFIRNWALNLNGFDGISHYWRVALALNSDSWTALIDTILKGPGGLNLNLGSPTQTGTTAKDSTEAESESADGAEDAPAGGVGNLLKPLNGLTKGLTGGSLLQKKQAPDGSSTGLDKKQESSLLGFLLGGGK